MTGSYLFTLLSFSSKCVLISPEEWMASNCLLRATIRFVHCSVFPEINSAVGWTCPFMLAISAPMLLVPFSSCSSWLMTSFSLGIIVFQWFEPTFCFSSSRSLYVVNRAQTTVSCDLCPLACSVLYADCQHPLLSSIVLYKVFFFTSFLQVISSLVCITRFCCPCLCAQRHKLTNPECSPSQLHLTRKHLKSSITHSHRQKNCVDAQYLHGVSAVVAQPSSLGGLLCVSTVSKSEQVLLVYQ